MRSVRIAPHGTAGMKTALAIVGVAAVLRFMALDFGAGVTDPRPDEPGVVATLGAIEAGYLYPMHMAYGGGYFYPLHAFVKLWSWAAWADGLSAEVSAHPERVRVVARAWSALLSTVTVWLVFAIGTRLGGTRTGLLAAALMASSTVAIREAHFAKADSAAAAATALLLLALTRSWSSPDRRALAIGAAGGLALSTKYLVGLLPAILLALARGGRSEGRAVEPRSVAVGTIALATVVLALNTPWIRWPRTAWLFMQAIIDSQWTYTHQAWLADALVSPLRYHATVSLPFGCGTGFAILALPGLVLGLARRESRLIALAVLGHCAVLLLNPLVLARNLLPAVPGLAVLTAALLVTAVDRLVRAPVHRALALGLAAAVLTAEPLLNGARLVRLLGLPDTRALATRWIEEHVPEDARIVSLGAPTWAVGFGMPAVGGRTVFTRLPPAQWRARGVTLVVRHQHPLPFSREPMPAGGVPPLRSLAVFDPFDGPLHDPVFEPQDAFFLPLARFSGIKRPGPRIEIFALAP